MEKLGFQSYFNYLDHEGMEKMLSSEMGDKLLELAKNISVCLHEDWKQNLIREKGKDYQHFRSVKDPAFAEKVLANKDEYLAKLSEDGKPLFKIIESETDGKVTYDVQFDLIRVPFHELTEKWQNANLEAAKFALCLVKSASDKGDLQVTGEELFKNFENMSHDVHLEWIAREGDWAAPELLLPYEYLTVDTTGYNQKDKDRAHVTATTTELTFQPNILARNRSIVIRAINELFGSATISSGLNPEIMQNLSEIQPLIEAQNNLDFECYQKTKSAVWQKAEKLLSNKTEISFDDIEKLAATYYEAWKESVSHLGKLPKAVDVPYDKIIVDDPRVNHKNIARTETKKILEEMVKEEILSPEISVILNGISDKSTPLGKRIATKNETDFADYQAMFAAKRD